MRIFLSFALIFLFSAASVLGAEIFHLPTTNRALFEKGGEEIFFVGTTGKPWTSGTFGCVRSDGHQIHEGLDIKSVQHDKRGEPADKILATADGTVAYVNRKPSLSNYGNYIVLRHVIEGLEIYSVYAHLSEAREDLKPGQEIKAGETIATMGRTSNTRERISKERAHVHFELNLRYQDHFASWYRKNFSGQRNDHGEWNGQNLAGLDARLILLAQHEQGEKFRLANWMQNRTELCRVFVRQTDFPFLRHYAPLIRKNSVAEKAGIVGYEIALDFNGVPIQLTPRTSDGVKSSATYQLLSVNETEQEKNPCRKLVSKRSGRWSLTSHGTQLLDLLTFREK